MQIIFYDKKRETYLAVGIVTQLESVTKRVNGRLTNLWMLTMMDGTSKSFKQADYSIHRIDI